MRDLLVATRNKGKVDEFRAFFKDSAFKILSLDEAGVDADFEPEETGTTFEENAEIKAREYGKKAQMLTIADDSGICVDALGGEPGVRSARYAEGTDKTRYEVVLDKMKDVPDDNRAATFVSVIAVYDPSSDRMMTTRGECLGHVLREARGEGGFGYDPIFFVDEIGKTYAEATLEEKQSVDHRGKALRLMREQLEQEYV